MVTYDWDSTILSQIKIIDAMMTRNGKKTNEHCCVKIPVRLVKVLNIPSTIKHLRCYHFYLVNDVSSTFDPGLKQGEIL